MSLKELLVVRFGPLMTYADMAALFGLGGAMAADAMRQRMRRDRLLGTQLRACAVRLGRRTYFRADLVAAAIGELTSVSGPRVQGIGAPAGSDSHVSDAVVSPPGNAQEGGQ